MNIKKHIISKYQLSDTQVCSSFAFDLNGAIYFLAVNVQENRRVSCTLYKFQQGQAPLPFVTIPINIPQTGYLRMPLICCNNQIIVGASTRFFSKLLSYSITGELIWSIEFQEQIAKLFNFNGNILAVIGTNVTHVKILCISADGEIKWSVYPNKMYLLRTGKDRFFTSEKDKISVYDAYGNNLASLPFSHSSPPLEFHLDYTLGEVTHIPIEDNTRIVSLDNNGNLIANTPFPYLGINLSLTSVSNSLLYAVTRFDTLCKIDTTTNNIVAHRKLKTKTVFPVFIHNNKLFISANLPRKKSQICVFSEELIPLQKYSLDGDIIDFSIAADGQLYALTQAFYTATVYVISEDKEKAKKTVQSS